MMVACVSPYSSLALALLLNVALRATYIGPDNNSTIMRSSARSSLEFKTVNENSALAVFGCCKDFIIDKTSYKVRLLLRQWNYTISLCWYLFFLGYDFVAI